jgi:hypothetical protein
MYGRMYGVGTAWVPRMYERMYGVLTGTSRGRYVECQCCCVHRRRGRCTDRYVLGDGTATVSVAYIARRRRGPEGIHSGAVGRATCTSGGLAGVRGASSAEAVSGPPGSLVQYEGCLAELHRWNSRRL